MFQIHPHQGSNHPLLNQKLHPHQAYI
jgi:hypothetical protein